MKSEYFGDSYDIVKRFWAQRLRVVAPLYSHPDYIPERIRRSYSDVIGIPIYDSERRPNGPFGLLLDPHTGIPHDSENLRGKHPEYAALRSLLGIYSQCKPAYLICFDQSDDRHSGLSKAEQRMKKMMFLSGANLVSFYYVSHAPFLFTSHSDETLTVIRRKLAFLDVSNQDPERFQSLAH